MEILTYPNCRESIWLAILFLLWTVVAYIIFRIVGIPSYLISTFNYGTIAAALAIAFWRKSMDRSILHYNKPNKKILLLAIAGTFCIPWVHALIFSVIPQPEFITQMYTELMSEDILGNSGGIHLIINAIAFPFILEIIFRGVILRGLSTEYSAWKSILLAAVIYAGVWGCITLLPVQGLLYGLWYGWLYIYSRSLWTSILSFIFSQLTSVAYIMVSQWSTVPTEINSAMTGELWTVNLVTTLIFCLLTYCLYQTFKRNEI